MANLVRVIAHWTAGGGRASDLDRQHYHLLVESDGTIVKGTKTPEDNIVTADGDYAAHTLNLNAGSIGVAVCGMAGAVESPFSAGPSPITEKQWRVFCILIADLCRTYAIPVTEKTVLTHAEVQHTLGVRQRGKWDISRLPFRADLIGSKAVGDYMRALVAESVGGVTPSPESDRPILRTGARGRDVLDLQDQLARLNYLSGAIDGKFGPATRAAVLAFQADHGIVTDGVVGPQTWTALVAAGKRGDINPVAAARAKDTTADLRKKGSETIASADKAQAAIGSVVGAVGLDAIIADPVATVEKVNAIYSVPVVGSIIAFAQERPLLIVAGVLVVVALLYAQRVKDRRVADHASGANRGR